MTLLLCELPAAVGWASFFVCALALLTLVVGGLIGREERIEPPRRDWPEED
ncbi:MAG: hypothetical protein HW378_210 [Anaerolineales bacterium]|nr:hypothetical protein [Anaerolineales bacterium]